MGEPTKQKSEWATVGMGVIDGEGDDSSARGNEPQAALPVSAGQLGLWIFLATVTMLFAGFTSAYLVRQATGSDWRPIPLPPILWLNTALLISSSLTLERGRARLRQGHGGALKGWLIATTLLGLAFLVGQLLAWRQLAGDGVYLPSNPHSSFFYILTGVHGVHLLGGLGVLVYVVVAAWSARPRLRQQHRLKLCATYWHFVDGLWLYLFLVLFVL